MVARIWVGAVRVTSLADIARWRLRAEECRMAAEQMKDATARGELIGVADSYEKLAASAEARLKVAANTGSQLPRGRGRIAVTPVRIGPLPGTSFPSPSIRVT